MPFSAAQGKRIEPCRCKLGSCRHSSPQLRIADQEWDWKDHKRRRERLTPNAGTLLCVCFSSVAGYEVDRAKCRGGRVSVCPCVLKEDSRVSQGIMFYFHSLKKNVYFLLTHKTHIPKTRHLPRPCFPSNICPNSTKNEYK